jgi:hypothetical protein
VTVRYRNLSVLSNMVVSDRTLPTLRKTVKQQAEVSGGSRAGIRPHGCGAWCAR